MGFQQGVTSFKWIIPAFALLQVGQRECTAGKSIRLRDCYQVLEKRKYALDRVVAAGVEDERNPRN